MERITLFISKCRRNGWYINGTRGVISLLLIIIMLPFVMIAGVLINSARLNSAVAIFDEALCNASNSTLGTYESFLRKRFGLLAIQQYDPSKGASYTPEQLIAETFEFYMEQNGFSLSNTYHEMDAIADGIYPLADRNVMISQIRESGKYSVPAKLVIDGLNLEDFASLLTKSMKSVSSVFSLISTGTDTVTNLNSAQDAFDELETQSKKAEEKKDTYDTSYTSFVSAINDYNQTIDNRNRDVGNAKAAYEQKRDSSDAADVKYSGLQSQAAQVENQIANLKNEKDSKGKPVNNSEKIKQLEADNSELFKKRDDAYQEAVKAENAEQSAKNTYNKTVADYETALDSKQLTFNTKKSDYLTAIDELVTELKELRKDVKTAQEKLSAVSESAAKFFSSGISTVSTIYTQNKKAEIDDMKDQLKQAKKNNDGAKIKELEDKIKEQEAKNDTPTTIVSDISKGISTGTSENLDILEMKSIDDFIKTEFTSIIDTQVTDLGTVRSDVNKTTVPARYSKIAVSGTINVAIQINPASKSLEDLQEGLIGQLVGSGLLSLIRSIVGFVVAILKSVTTIDPDLYGVVNPALYKTSGQNGQAAKAGLPSTRSQSEFDSVFSDTDSAMSELYKNELGSYSNTATQDSGVGDALSGAIALMNIISSVDTSEKGLRMRKIFKGIAFLWTNILIPIFDFMKKVYNTVVGQVEKIGNKALIAGYLTYNTANRTTYSGKALTGASFALSAKDKLPGYNFYGAETEYLLIGSYTESNNIMGVFGMIFGLRLVMNIIPVMTNAELQTIATAMGVVSFGLGTFIVYALWTLAESLVDAVLLAGGETVNIIKTKLFLTPSGIGDAVQKLIGLGLTKGGEAFMQKDVIKTMSGEKLSDEQIDKILNTPKSETPKKTGVQKVGDTLADTFSLNYTKICFLFLCMWSVDTLVSRFSDIVEMEATVNIRDDGNDYIFDLGKSYTYLRATGNFTTSGFMQLSESDGAYHSKDRVVYRGY